MIFFLFASSIIDSHGEDNRGGELHDFTTGADIPSGLMLAGQQSSQRKKLSTT